MSDDVIAKLKSAGFIESADERQELLHRAGIDSIQWRSVLRVLMAVGLAALWWLVT